MIAVLLVEDHPIVRAGYHHFLDRSRGVEVVAEAADAEEGYRLFCQHAPDVSVVDLSMPGASGIGLIGRMVAREPAAHVLAVSMHEEPAFASRALQAGALGYVSKCNPPEILLAGVSAVHAGRPYLSPDMARRLPLGEAATDPLAVLSTKEFEVFRLIAQGAPLNEVADKVNLSCKTVANYQTVIKAKLGVATSTALVHVALRHGVIPPPQ